MRLLLSVEKRIGRQLDPDEAVRVECLSDIAALLKNNNPATYRHPPGLRGNRRLCARRCHDTSISREA